MLSKIVHLVLRRPAVVMMLGLLTALYGLHVARHAQFDVFPEFIPPTVTVQVEAPGLPPADVETRVTTPLEHALGGTPNVILMTSQSGQGLSVIKTTFRDGTSLAKARQQISERLAGVPLPTGVRAPAMSPQTSSSEVVLEIGIVPTTGDFDKLHSVAEWSVRPRLLAVPGVADATVLGGKVPRLEVRFDPKRLATHGLGLDEVVLALRDGLGAVAGSTVDVGHQRVVIQAPPPASTPKAIGQMVLRTGPEGPICVRDVADVVMGAEPAIGAAAIMGKPGVVMEISAQAGANTLEVTHAVEAVLSELKPTLASQGYQLHTDLFRPASFIELAVHNAGFSLALGGFLVTLIILAFLADMRSAAITLTAIPISLLTAVVVLNSLGMTLNTITLGGLAIAIGEVVDDAIIDVENILRRLRENTHAISPKPLFQVIHAASLEVRGSVVYATLIVVLVFIPVLMMGGTAGRLFGPLAIAYISAILASLAVALTLTPAMTAVLLKPGRIRVHEPAPVIWLKTHYERLLGRLLRHPKPVLTLSLLACLSAFAVIPLLKLAFIPELNEGHLVVHMTALPGTGAEESLRLGEKVTALLRQDPRVRKIDQRVGRAELGADTVGTNSSEFSVELNPTHDKAEDLQADIRAKLETIPGVGFRIFSFLSERIAETSTASAAPASIKVYGHDLAQLDTVADKIVQVVEKIPGSHNAARTTPGGLPTATFLLKPEGLRLHGFTPGQVTTALQMACDGLQVSEVHNGVQPLGVTLRIARPKNAAPETLPHLLLRAPDGHQVALGELASLEMKEGRLSIPHQNGMRFQEITSDVDTKITTLTDFMKQAKRAIAQQIVLPPGVSLAFVSTADAADAARSDLIWWSCLSGIGILLILWIVYRTPRNLVLILANIPFALIGGLATVLLISHGELSVGTLVGFVALLGLSIRNTIMLISHYEYLVREEHLPWNASTALHGARERVIPVLMTAMVTALGLLPVALSASSAGGEIEGPMAIVILGGLASATLLTLLVLPTLTLRFGRMQACQLDTIHT